MKVKAFKFKKNEIFLIPIGDLHIGEKAFNKHSKEKLEGYIKWVKDTKNAYVFLMGDLINVATTNSRSSPFEQTMGTQEQIEKVIEYFSPIKDRILGAISGNHECFDEETEVLTNEGWKKQWEITEGTIFLTYNKDLDTIEEQKAIEIQRYKVRNEEMIEIKNKHTDLLITKNHRLYYNKGTDSKFETKKFNEMFIGNNRIGFVCSGSMKKPEYPIKDDELRILAWLLTDGSLRKKQITFYQRKSKYHLITSILDALEWKYAVRERNRNIKSICGKQLKTQQPAMEIDLKSPYNHRLVELTNNDKKHLPEFLFEISDRQFKVFLNSFIDGDGSRHISAPDTSLMVYTNNKNMAIDLQTLCFLHNFRTSITEYRKGNYRLNITENRVTNIDRFKNHIKKKKYNGVKWDITTPNDTVIVKRNNKITITGNCRLEPYTGYNPTITICDKLGCFYFGYDAVLILRLGCHGFRNTSRASFSIYAHHTTGGGSTLGGKMNRVAKLREVVCDADAYLGAHNHMLGCVHDGIFKINETTGSVDFLRQMFIDCGGYLGYEDSYANKKQLPPVKLGSPKIRLLVKRNGKDEVRKDIHVSL